MAKFKWDTVHRGRRCGHSWCTDCRTKRGHNRGNRRMRHTINTILHKIASTDRDGGD